MTPDRIASCARATVTSRYRAWRRSAPVAILAIFALLAAAAPFGTAAATVLTFGGGTIMVTRETPPVSPKCEDLDALLIVTVLGGYLTDFEKECVYWDLALFAKSKGLVQSSAASAMNAQNTAIPLARERRSSRPAAITAWASLDWSKPYVPFLGNPLVVLGSVFDNSSNPAASTTGYAFALRRQADCSLEGDFLNDPDATTPAGVGLSFMPSAQDYFHQLAGLTTKPDVFANGCAYPTLGQPSSKGALLVGNNASGGVFGVQAANGLLAFADDLSANTFSSSTLLSSSVFTGGVQVADLNGDGNLDVIASPVTDPATSRPATVVFLGKGDGTYQPGVYYDVAGDITIADVNGDGKPDIVVVGVVGDASTTAGVTTLIGKGDGTFTLGPNSATTVGGALAGSVLSADLNGDGHADLIVGGTVLLGKGDGTFTVGAPITTDSAFYLQNTIPDVAIGDVNNDGKLDVVISQPGFVAIFYGKGDGTFTAGSRYAALPDALQVSLTDIDGDGNLDIVLGASTGGIYQSGGYDQSVPMFQILMGRGDGTFVDSLAYGVSPGPSAQRGSVGYGAQIAGGSFTGSGKGDVLVLDGNASGVLTVLPGDGTGGLGAAITSVSTVSPAMVVAADMNGDGKPDAVVAGMSAGAPTLAVLINQGNGQFAAEQDYALPDVPVSLAVGDFNGDGRPDVAVGVAAPPGGSGPTGVYVLFGQANGTLTAPVRIDGSLYPTGLAAGDLNGDGRTDLVVADQGVASYVGSAQQVNGALHVYLGNADGTFTAAVAPTTTATNYTVAALTDLNGDGKLDLVVAGDVLTTTAGAGAPTVYALLGNGDATFKTPNAITLAGNDGIGATAIALADFDKDGHIDVAVGNPLDGTELLLGNGDGTFALTAAALGQRPLALAAVDLSGSGLPDLLVGSTGSGGTRGTLAVLQNPSAAAWVAAATGASSTTTLSASPSPATVGQSVTLTATVSSTSAGAPTGTVSFLDGSATLGSVSLSANGTAAYTTSSLGSGSHSLTAQYGGDTTFAGSTSAAVTLAVNAPADFAISANSASGSIAPGASAATVLTLTPSGGFSGTVTLACSGLPSGAVCSFSPASVSMSGSAAATSTLTISTAAMAAQSSAGSGRAPVDPMAAPGGVLLAGVMPPILAGRRRGRTGSKAGILLAGIIGLMAFGALISGCGGGGGGSPAPTGGTPAGTYTVTVSATSGTQSHSLTYTLTVT
jgi:hypothetical protein